MIKVQNGTRSGKNLCETCHSGQVMKGDADSDVRVYCHAVEHYLSRKVLECSRHTDRSQPSISNLYDIAWILETSKNKRVVGFTKWADYSKKHGTDEKYSHE